MKYNGTVYTVGVPKGRDADADIATQTKITLDTIDARLAEAGTDKSRILEATVFLTSMSDFKGMNEEWNKW